MYNAWYEWPSEDADFLINLNKFEGISLQYPETWADRTEHCRIVFSRDVSTSIDDFILAFSSIEEAKFEFDKIKRALS